MSLSLVAAEERLWLVSQTENTRLRFLLDYRQFFRDAEVFFADLLELVPQEVIAELEEEYELLDHYHTLAYSQVVLAPFSYSKLILKYVKLKTEFHDKLLKELEFYGSQKQDNPEAQARIGITSDYLWRLPGAVVGFGSVSE